MVLRGLSVVVGSTCVIIVMEYDKYSTTLIIVVTVVRRTVQDPGFSSFGRLEMTISDATCKDLLLGVS